MWLSTERKRLPMPPARVGAVEHRVVLGLEERRALQRHRAADVDVGGLDLGPVEAEVGEEVERRVVQLVGRHAERVRVRKSSPSVHLLNTNRMSKALFSAALDRRDLVVGEALDAQRRRVDGRAPLERAVADRVGLDLGDLRLAVAERAQRIGHRAVDDLEVAAAGELLELHQREVGLDAGGVAVHHQADRAGRRDHRRLRVAVAVRLAERERPVPGRLGVLDQDRRRGRSA